MAPRIGELLLAHHWVDPVGLARAIAEQAHTGRRLCSLLIARGMLDHDNAARALAEQRGMPGVLLRHLEGREAGLAYLIPPELGRTHMALPIGRTGAGALIVCVRDPSPAAHAAIVAATRGPVVLAVAPASRLEQLVHQVYGDSDNADFDVDMSTGPITLPIALDPEPDPLHIGGAEFALVELDDARVAKDHSQSGTFVRPRDSRPSIPLPTAPPPPAPAPPPPTLDATLTALESAPARDAATDLAIAFAAGRWRSALLVTIKDGAALGHRGHGVRDAAVETIALPMSAPSMLKVAHDTKHVTAQVPVGPIQDRLGRLLGQPTTPAAAPIVVAARVIGALVVGDPVGAPADVTADLECLAEALGLAYARILLEAKQAGA